MLDFSIITKHHGLVVVASFIAVWLSLFLFRNHHASHGKSKTNVYRGGVVLIIATVIMTSLILDDSGLFLSLVLAATVVAIIGRRDERRPMSAGRQLVWQIIIAVIVVIGGWTIPYISHPGGETIIDLHWSQFGPWIIPGSFLAVLWLVGLMNTINWLDGVDGLAGAVGSVAFLTLAGVSLLPATQDKQTLVLSLIGLGTMLAFLWWNWPPARVYLGTSGSWFLGLYLGLVAMVGGGKIATTLLVLAWPTVDAILVIGQRLLNKQKPWQGDASHFHYQLLARGWTPRTITIVAALTSLLCGWAAITLQTNHKVGVIGLIALTMLVIIATLKR